MLITRLSSLAYSFLLVGLCLLLGAISPAAARAHRAHRALHKLHQHRRHGRILIPRMLPTVIPADREGYVTVLRGRASWYGKYFQGMKTSSGERYDRFQYTCAHKKLPFGTRLRVTCVENGVSVIVRVTDRGPFRKERIIDLSEIAARPMGLVESGSATVVAEVVPQDTPLGPTGTPDHLARLVESDPNPHAKFTAYQLPEAAVQSPLPLVAATAPVTPILLTAVAVQPPAARQYELATGQFADLQSALVLLARIQTISDKLPVRIGREVINGQPMNRVFVGQLDSWLAAETVRRNLQMWGIAGLVRETNAVEPQPALAEATSIQTVMASTR